jgi:tetratricopeptide (TPR) repeat protein
MSLRSLLLIVAVLAVGALVVPQIASAWSLNQANVSISHAMALPLDAPARVTTLTQANAILNQGLDFAPLERMALARARAELAGDDARGALAAFEPPILVAGDPITEYVWGEAAWRANEKDKALAHWRRAGAITFFMQEAHRAIDNHEWKKAADLAAIAVEVAPDDADAHYVLADATSRQLPIVPLVFAELDRSQQLVRDSEFLATILSRRAEILASQGQLEQAKALFDRARQVAPIDARPRTGYALVQIKLDPGAREQAAALLKQVTGDSPWYTDAFIALANIAESNGDVQGAETWLQEGLNRNRNDARLLLPLGELYARQQRLGQARKTFILALSYETHSDDLQEIVRQLAGLPSQ